MKWSSTSLLFFRPQQRKNWVHHDKVLHKVGGQDSRLALSLFHYSEWKIRLLVNGPYSFVNSFGEILHIVFIEPCNGNPRGVGHVDGVFSYV